MPVTDEKYVVFKRSEWDASQRGEGVPTLLDDATVIRSQDVFAGPALHAYASSIETSLEILEALGWDVDSVAVKRMEDARDYFFQRALEADDVRTKKVPD